MIFANVLFVRQTALRTVTDIVIGVIIISLLAILVVKDMPLTLKEILGRLGIRLHKKLAVGHVIELEYISQNGLWGGGYNHNTHERGFFPMSMLFIPSTAADRSKRPTNFKLELTAGKFLYFTQHSACSSLVLHCY
jgi:hypothetical protein